MNFYQKIVNNGVAKLTTEKEKRLGRITNTLLLIMFVAISIAGIVIVASGIESVILYNIALILVLTITGFLLNKAGYFTATKIIFLVGFNLIVLFVSLKIDWKGFVPFTSMLFLLVPVLVFGKKEKIWRYILIAIPVLCYITLIYTDYDVSFIEKEYLDPEKVKIIQVNNILVVVFTIVLFVYSFITTIEKSEKELESTISELKEKNKVIQRQNEELLSSEEELSQNLERLNETQESLEQKNAEIETAYTELKTSQKQLIQSEKMASLGHLVANIAHEINTPLGAIRSSADSMEQILLQTLPNLSPFIQKLDKQTTSDFNDFVKIAAQKTNTLSSREKRAIRREMMKEFENSSISNVESFADLVVDMNMHDEKTLVNVLVGKENTTEIFDTAYQLSTIIRSNQIIIEATNRAAKTVFALKNFARQDKADQKAEVNINETLETTLTLYYNQIKQGIDVIRNFEEIPVFLGYPDELMQVWTNLIHNAIQAMHSKGKLTISTKMNENKVLVSIQDTGVGIPQEVQDKIFDAFFTTKSVGEGSGLGLDITKKIIEKHEGKIWFETEEGIGTTFFVEIPITLTKT